LVRAMGFPPVAHPLLAVRFLFASRVFLVSVAQTTWSVLL
jgi:hypothetical protein